VNAIQSTNLVQFGPQANLGKETDFGPAIAFGNGRFFIAWIDSDGHPNVMSSINGLGSGASNTTVLSGDVTDAAPRLTFFSGKLYLTYKGTNHHLFVVELTATPLPIFQQRVQVNERTDFAPSLEQDSQSNRLYLAWRGRRLFGLIFELNKQLNVRIWKDVTDLFTNPGGGRKFSFFDTSDAGPALAMFKDQLYLGWQGTDNRPNVAALMHPEPLTSSIVAARGMPGGALSISANGPDLDTGIVWASIPREGDANHCDVPGVLRAFNATTLDELWNSELCPGRDGIKSYAKFVPPTIANGKVYLPSFNGKVHVYGLHPPQTCSQ
jgi:outer membrane protein assembly factor BamB